MPPKPTAPASPTTPAAGSPAKKTAAAAVAAANFKPHPDGTRCAFLVPSESWLLGKVLSFNPGAKAYTCQSEDPVVKAEKVPHTDIQVMREESFQDEPHDLLFLTELSEPTLLYALRRRYYKDWVYTNIGAIVVAINPFSFEIPHYKDDRMQDYLRQGVEVENQLPHTWSISHSTYQSMRLNMANHCILISGESGAGKTEAAKIVVKYVGILSTQHGTKEQKQAMSVINSKVVSASPILETFGNAKTVRNDNSSRFGKFMQLQFDRDGFLVGSFAIKYLLEKSRIIGSAQDERVYHSFYQLAVGDDHKTYGIGKNKRAYKMLDMGNCLTVESIDDAGDFTTCKGAMKLVGVTDSEQHSIWRIVAGILSFQNVQFVENEVNGNKSAQIDPDFEAALERSCEHWGVELAEVLRELTTVTRVAKKEKVTSSLDKVKALDTRDSCSKGLYDALFDWLVERINVTTDFRRTGGTVAQWIGLLDIFGFEDFVCNSFEQICINLANETLQNHYNNFIFRADLKECEDEGIDVTHVTFEDNRGCLELLSLDRISIFGMLNEECSLGSGSDKGFMAKILDNFAATREKTGNKYFLATTGKQKDNSFKIKHYAGDVVYTVEGWLEKNRDTFKDDMKLIFKRSSDPFIVALVPTPADPDTAAQKLSVCAYFAKQLHELMGMINSTSPGWIRCIKPHPAKKPRMFSNITVMSQLRSAGVLETVRVRQGGYPIRFTQDLFTLRYKILTDSIPGSSAAEKCRVLLFDQMKFGKEIAQMGKSKIFLRQAAFQKLNSAKDVATERYSLVFQGAARAYAVRTALCKQYLAVHRERLLAEKRAREEVLRRAREEENRRTKAVREEKERRDRAEHATRTEAVIVIQRAVRRFNAFRQLRRCAMEALRVQDENSTLQLVLSWRTSVFDLLDHRIHAQEALVKDKKSRTAAELAAAQRQNKTAGDGTVSTAQLLQRVQDRRQDLAQQTNDRIALIRKKAADQEALFGKKLAAAREREKLKQKEQLAAQKQETHVFAVKRGLMPLSSSSPLSRAGGNSFSAMRGGAAANSSIASPRVNLTREQILDAEMNRKVDMARSRQDHRAKVSWHELQQQQESATLFQTQRRAMTETEQDDATRAVFAEVRDGWARQNEWKEQRDAVFERDRLVMVERAKLTQRKEALLSSDYRVTAPSALLSPMYAVLEDEQRHRDPYTASPTRLTADERRREALYQFEMLSKNNSSGNDSNGRK